MVLNSRIKTARPVLARIRPHSSHSWPGAKQCELCACSHAQRFCALAGRGVRRLSRAAHVAGRCAYLPSRTLLSGTASSHSRRLRGVFEVAEWSVQQKFEHAAVAPTRWRIDLCTVWSLTRLPSLSFSPFFSKKDKKFWRVPSHALIDPLVALRCIEARLSVPSVALGPYMSEGCALTRRLKLAKGTCFGHIWTARQARGTAHSGRRRKCWRRSIFAAAWYGNVWYHGAHV